MQIFESILAILVAAVATSALARRWHLPYPALLAVLGAGLAFMPGLTHFRLDPQLALALLVAPVLLDAAFDASPRDLRAHWAPIGSLVVVAVGATTLVVAAVAKALVPDLSWAGAIALGAIVAPPDAAAASAVLRTARLPHRLVQILEGESLLNDATALLIYRAAVALAVGGVASPSLALPEMALTVVGSLVLGYALARAVVWLNGRISDVPTSIVLQFCETFGVWILAERIGLSGILTVVSYAVVLARRVSAPARIRRPSYAVWETTVFVLNALAFVLIGLQVRPILERLDSQARVDYALGALAVLGVVIATRLGWTLLSAMWVGRWFAAEPSPGPRARYGGALVVGWCGMRGIVTLAAALALPEAFPGRAFVLVAAFGVVLGTLLLQGLTLGPLLRWLDLGDDGQVDREEALAREKMMSAALSSFEASDGSAAEALRQEIALVWSGLGGAASATQTGDGRSELRWRALIAAREATAGLRGQGVIGDDAFHRVEVDLDRFELVADSLTPGTSR